MGCFVLLSEAQMRGIEGYFPRLHGIARVDDRRIVSAIVFVIRNGLRWRDAPPDYSPHKTVYNRFIRWSRLGVFNKIFAELEHRAFRLNRKGFLFCFGRDSLRLGGDLRCRSPIRWTCVNALRHTLRRAIRDERPRRISAYRPRSSST